MEPENGRQRNRGGKKGDDMICPYNRKSELQVLQREQTTEEESTTKCEQIDRFEFEMMERPREGCAVWYDGRCHYAAVNLDNQ